MQVGCGQVGVTESLKEIAARTRNTARWCRSERDPIDSVRFFVLRQVGRERRTAWCGASPQGQGRDRDLSLRGQSRSARRTSAAPGGGTMSCLGWKLLVLLSAMLSAVALARADIPVGDPSRMTGPVSWAGEQRSVAPSQLSPQSPARGAPTSHVVRAISAHVRKAAERADA
jgi:hypothetical protein